MIPPWCSCSPPVPPAQPDPLWSGRQEVAAGEAAARAFCWSPIRRPAASRSWFLPVESPRTIPPADQSTRAPDPRDYTGRGVEGGVGNGVLGGTGPVIPGATYGYGGEEGPYPESFPEERYTKAVVLFQPAPTYPAPMRAARVSGAVVVSFIIDTLGRVEPASVQILETPHAAFEPVAREVILRSRFRPARLGDRAVRQLTVQRITFVLQTF